MRAATGHQAKSDDSSLARAPAGGRYETLMDEAMALHRGGQLQNAARLYRQALTYEPQSPEAWHLCGVALLQLQRHDECLKALTRAVALQPQKTLFRMSLASALKAAGNHTAAADQYERVIAEAPDQMEAYDRLGELLWEVRRLEEAAGVCHKAIQHNPDHTLAYLNLARVLKDAGRGSDALPVLQRTLRREPRSLATWNALGDQLRLLGRLSEALEACRQALQLDPDYVEAVANAGMVMQQLGQADKALSCFQAALTRRPALEKTHSALLFNMLYLPECDAQHHLAEARRWWQMHGQPLAGHADDAATSACDSQKRLRIGYVSPDLRRHSVSYFLRPLIEAHDRRQVEVFCYAEVSRPDEVTQQLKALADGWRFTVGMSDDALAQRIRSDRIDILVDLAGHTVGNRLLVFARKPAPLQITWLGYAATTGMATMDYRITDAIADPVDQSQSHCSESLLRLDNGFLCYRPPEHAPAVSSLPARASGVITFGSFNALPKVNAAVIALWSQILQQVASSRLLLKCKQLGDAGARARYRQLFRQQGIAAERVTMRGFAASGSDHLHGYDEVDLALDTFPYNGTTTTCEALWMGVPVIALRGDRHAARVGASLLQRVGLEECIAADPTAYVATALSLAGDWERLERLRAGMRERLYASALCDAKGFAAAMEAGLRQAWTRRCRV